MYQKFGQHREEPLAIDLTRGWSPQPRISPAPTARHRLHSFQKPQPLHQPISRSVFVFENAEHPSHEETILELAHRSRCDATAYLFERFGVEVDRRERRDVADRGHSADPSVAVDLAGADCGEPDRNQESPGDGCNPVSACSSERPLALRNPAALRTATRALQPGQLVPAFWTPPSSAGPVGEEPPDGDHAPSDRDEPAQDQPCDVEHRHNLIVSRRCEHGDDGGRKNETRACPCPWSLPHPAIRCPESHMRRASQECEA